MQSKTDKFSGNLIFPKQYNIIQWMYYIFIAILWICVHQKIIHFYAMGKAIEISEAIFFRNLRIHSLPKGLHNAASDKSAELEIFSYWAGDDIDKFELSLFDIKWNKMSNSRVNQTNIM